MDTAALYRRFACSEAEGHSPCYEQWAKGVASCQHIVSLLDQLPPEKRQPNLIFGVARFLGMSAPAPFPLFRDWLMENWNPVREEIRKRRTQTNEVGRCAVLLPVLAALSPPLALIEVGASAGLCLYPDRFSYQYDDRPPIHPSLGPSSVLLPCQTKGPIPYPSAVPWIAWRAGIDLNPLDVTEAEDRRWLEALVWPEQETRRARLRAAIEIARREPPYLMQGDLNQTVMTLVKQAPPEVAIVVFHSAVLAYLDDQGRRLFEKLMRELPCCWISNESSAVIESIAKHLPPAAEENKSRFVLALNGRPLAYTGPHGQSLEWL